ncbi:hypothetical protein [Polyangium spumosum]|uniref:hypothetical protein n=1 Tax=Polyangium spumosum TaxID=889282 RepID=UPI00147905B8|nr:hypothetical protein [Polyangium spumosum]
MADLRYPCNDAGAGYPAKGERMAGLCDVDIATKRAWISVQRPRTMKQLRAWPEVVLHEVMHVLGAATRAPGWTIQQEHRTINALVPTLAKARRRTPDLAASAARTLAEAYRRAAVEIAARRVSPNETFVRAAAAMTVTPQSSGSR